MYKKEILLLACVLLGTLNVLFLVSAATMRYVEPADALTFNPLYVSDRIALRLCTLSYLNLVGEDPTFNLRPELLESLTSTQASNGIYRFKLKSDVQWVGYDGDEGKLVVLKPFTAQDVVHTFTEIRDSSEPTRYDFLKTLFTEVTAISDNEVEFKVRKERLDLDQDFIIRSLQFAVIPDLSNFRGHVEVFRGQPAVGTGPFIMIEESYDRVELKRNEEYFRVFHPNTERSSEHLEISEIQMAIKADMNPSIDAITISGRPKLHLITEIPLVNYSQVKQTNISMPIHGPNSFTYIAYNCRGAFRDKRLRLAFTHAFDRQKVFVNVYGGIYPGRDQLPLKDIEEIIHCPLPASQTPPDIPIIEHDSGRALELKQEIMGDETVDEGLKRKIKEGFDLLAYAETPMEDRVCRQFAAQIEETLGIPIRFNTTLGKSEWFNRIGNGDFEVAFGRAVFSQNVNVIRSLFHSNSSQNVVDYRNDRIDTLLDEYDRANHPEIRDKIRKEMAEIIANDVPYTFLYRIPRWAAYRNDALGGAEIHPYYFFSFIDQWYMKRRSP